MLPLACFSVSLFASQLTPYFPACLSLSLFLAFLSSFRELTPSDSPIPSTGHRFDVSLLVSQTEISIARFPTFGCESLRLPSVYAFLCLLRITIQRYNAYLCCVSMYLCFSLCFATIAIAQFPGWSPLSMRVSLMFMRFSVFSLRATNSPDQSFVSCVSFFVS